MNRGDRGVAGERGPKGDHGQTGDRGATGLAGPRGRGIAVLFLLTCAFMTFVWWQSERDSCDRQKDPRTAQHVKYLLDADRARIIATHEHGDEKAINTIYASAYERLAALVKPIDCSGVVASVGANDSAAATRILRDARREVAALGSAP